MQRPLALMLLAISPLLGDGPSRELAAPDRIEAGGRPIDTEIGHAAPFVGDFDGDGIHDLLVGQFGGGVLWVFRSVGDDHEPALSAGTKFQADGKDGVVPTG